MANPEHVERLTYQGHRIACVGDSSRLPANAAESTAKREMGKTETGSLTE
jgi:hypothetical protein